MDNKQKGRRRFLKSSAALGITAGVMRPSVGQSLHPDVIHVTEPRPRGKLSKYEDTRRIGLRRPNSPEALTPLQDLQGIITPTELHFVVDHESGVLYDINPEEYRMKIHGMVDRPLVFTLDELKRLPSESGIYALHCGSTGGDAFRRGAVTPQDTHGRTSTSEWSGVLLKTLLEEAGVQEGAKWVIAIAADTSDHAASIPIERAMDGITMAAYAQNGESVRIDNGYPVRLVIPGYEGRFLVKWLTQLLVVDDTYMTRQDGFNNEDRFRDRRGFMMATDRTRAFRMDVTPHSVITSPAGGFQMSGPGYYEINGLAWTGQAPGTVARVEVSTDGGETWNDAKLQEPILPYAHTRFRYDWVWDGQECIIQSRCTDSRGDIQPTPDEVERTWGTDASKECFVQMGDMCLQVPRNTHNAFIMSWKIASNGEVTNPMRELFEDPPGLGHSHSGGHSFFDEIEE